MSDWPVLMVVCTGNICRSPMAEAVLRHQVQQRGLAARVDSCGLEAPIGRRAHRYARQVNEERGVPIDENKRSILCSEQVLQEASIIFVMEHHHRYQILHQYPAVGGKTFLLGHWQDIEIADPIRSPLSAFYEVYEQVELGCSTWLDHLLEAGMLDKV